MYFFTNMIYKAFILSWNQLEFQWTNYEKIDVSALLREFQLNFIKCVQ